MLSFHDDEKIKEKYLSRVKEHRKADNLIQGTGWEDGKGCAVGCTLENYDHKAYETELGIPEWLARVEDTLFEGMEKEDAMLWPERFLKAIPVGVDLEQAKAPFLIFVLETSLETFDHKKYPYCKKAIDDVIDLYCRGETDLNKYSAAARAAARAAAADDDGAAYAAYAADAAARAAAADDDGAAYAAARASADAAAYKKFADKLIEIFESLK